MFKNATITFYLSLGFIIPTTSLYSSEPKPSTPSIKNVNDLMVRRRKIEEEQKIQKIPTHIEKALEKGDESIVLPFFKDNDKAIAENSKALRYVDKDGWHPAIRAAAYGKMQLALKLAERQVDQTTKDHYNNRYTSLNVDWYTYFAHKPFSGKVKTWLRNMVPLDKFNLIHSEHAKEPHHNCFMFAFQSILQEHRPDFEIRRLALEEAGFAPRTGLAAFNLALILENLRLNNPEIWQVIDTKEKVTELYGDTSCCC